jgi:hypothetical protein
LIAVSIPSKRRRRNTIAALFYGIAIGWFLMSLCSLGNTELMTAVGHLNQATSGFGGWVMLFAFTAGVPALAVIIGNWIRGKK